MTYADIESRRRSVQGIRESLSQVGQGFTETALLRYRMAMDERRTQREDDLYAQKQMVDQQERRKEQVGAAIASIMFDPNLDDAKRRRKIMELANPTGPPAPGSGGNIDITDTSAGKMFFPNLFRRPGTPGAMTDEETQMTKYMDARRKADDAGDTATVALFDEKLGQMPRYNLLQRRVNGPAWLSDMKAGGFAEFVEGEAEDHIKGKVGTFDDRYGNDAYMAALQKAMVKGGQLGLPAEQIAGAFNEWWDREHKKNTGRWQTYADRSKFGPQQMATEGESMGGMSDMVATDSQRLQPPARTGPSLPETVSRGPRAPHPALNKVWPTLSGEQKSQAARARSNGWTWEQIAEAINRDK